MYPGAEVAGEISLPVWKNSMYNCTKCDAQFPKWTGRCDICDAWGTVQEEQATTSTTKTSKKGAALKSEPLSIGEKKNIQRITTKENEIDRVLGGGIVPGSVILLSGEPGIGKSTLVAALAAKVGSEKKPVLYISGEESNPQLTNRFSRLKLPLNHVEYLEAAPVESLAPTIEKNQPACVIVDSIQTIRSIGLDAAPGSPSMIRYATSIFIECAKRTHVPIILVGQVTKDGSIAGPKTLEHLVDVVLTLEGDPVHAFRLLRTNKNRFGSTNEIGVFEMTGQGLVAVPNPSERFLAERMSVPGSVIAATVEGSRIFMVEVQALVETTSYGQPARRASGFDQNRLQMLVAILSKRAGLKLSDKDVYINVIGGMELKEPAADLAVCAAISSALTNSTFETPTVFVGEVGLGGEIRSVPMLERRFDEMKRLGITTGVVPAKGIPKESTLNLKPIKILQELK